MIFIGHFSAMLLTKPTLEVCLKNLSSLIIKNYKGKTLIKCHKYILLVVIKTYIAYDEILS